MPRRPKLEVIETAKGHKLDIPATLSASGRRERFFYADKKAAEKHAKAVQRAYHERGTKAGTIAPALAEEATKALALLEPFGVSLLAAVKDYVARHEAHGARLTMSDAWANYIADLRKKGRAEATITDYVRDRKALPESFFKTCVGDLTEPAIAAALDKCTGNRGKTWNRRLREIRAVMTAATNTKTKQVSVKRRDPVILDAEQSAKLMGLAVAEDCALPFALMLFGGIRPDGEIGRISWGNIGENEIRITGEDSKTSDDRHIPISDNLAAWIEGHRDEPILPNNWKRKYQAIRKAAGIVDQDVLRHSFASMFYRLHGDKETTLAMGHTSFKTTEKFYKRAVTAAEAQAFFQIAPDGVEIEPPAALKAS
jgi:integrase